MIEAVIFDMDGVLIDAKEWHYEALNDALALFGFEISRHEHLTSFDGLPTSKKLEMLSVTHGLPRNLHSFINKVKQSYTMDLVYSQCRPKFVHEYALSRLHSEGFKLGVASNSVRNTVEIMMERSQLSAYLNVMLSNEDVEKPKPHPEIYLKAMDMLAVEPKNCLILEDNDHGIRAARASGAHVLEISVVEDVNYQNIVSAIEKSKNEVFKA